MTESHIDHNVMREISDAVRAAQAARLRCVMLKYLTQERNQRLLDNMNSESIWAAKQLEKGAKHDQ